MGYETDCVLWNTMAEGVAGSLVNSEIGVNPNSIGGLGFAADGYGIRFQKDQATRTTKYYDFINCIGQVNTFIIEKKWTPSISWNTNNDVFGWLNLSITHIGATGVVSYYNGAVDTFYIYVRQGGVQKCDYRYLDRFRFVAGTEYHIMWVLDTTEGATLRIRLYVDGVLLIPTSYNVDAAWNIIDTFDLSSHPAFWGGAGASTSVHSNIKIYDTVSAGLITAISDNSDNEGFDVIPTNVDATDGDYTTHVNIGWDESVWSDSYNVYRGLTLGGLYSELSGWQASNSYNDGSAVPGQVYYYKVIAQNTLGDSDLSVADDGYRAARVDVITYEEKHPQVLITDALVDIYALGYVGKLTDIIEQKTFQKDKLIVNQLVMLVKNFNDFFSLGNPKSLFSNSRWRFQTFRIINRDGEVTWDGILKQIFRDHRRKMAKIVSVDRLYKFQKRNISYESSDWETPAESFKNLCDQEGFIWYNENSVTDSINQLDEAKCYIWCHFGLANDITFQQACEKLGMIGGADVYTHKNEMYYQHWIPFAGGVKVDLLESDLLKNPIIKDSEKDIVNDYRIGYAGDLGISTTDSDNNKIGAESRLDINFGTRPFREMNGRIGNQIEIKDLTGAIYIGEVLIRRTHIDLNGLPRPHDIMDIEIPATHSTWIDLRTYFTQTYRAENWNKKIFEVFKSVRSEDKNNIKLTGYEVNI